MHEEPMESTVFLEKVVAFYQKTLSGSVRAHQSLAKIGLTDPHLLESHRVGYCNGKLKRILPSGEAIIRTLTTIGVLQADGSERLDGYFVFPLCDADGNLRGLSGWNKSEAQSRDDPCGKIRLWNLPAVTHYADVFFAENIIEALSLCMAGFPNVIAPTGEELLDTELSTLKNSGVRRLMVINRERCPARILSHLADIPLEFRDIPDQRTINSCLVEYGPQKLAELVEAVVKKATTSVALPPAGVTPLPGGFTAACGRRRYELRGVEKGARRLKATIRTEHAGKLHVDTLDFYSAKARKTLGLDLCRLFNEASDLIEADLVRLVRLCEDYKPDPSGDTPPQGMMSGEDRREAEAFGKQEDLFEQMLSDYEAAGLLGENANKRLCYLAAVSRKMDEPLSVLILSSSGAGKSALQDATLRLCPPEDVVKLTSITGKALFYKTLNSLKHKILAFEEGTGAEDAGYAIRNLVSARELTIESTIKDLSSGKLTTMENRVEGPTSVFITTTDPDVDPETRSRFFVLTVDESREQTRAILEHQRRRQTAAGLFNGADVDAVVKKHCNFQRLLKPLAVVNPFAERLTYEDDRLQSRRDQPKYLNLIRAVAFLKQMAKPVKEAGGRHFIEADEDDVRIAGELAREIMGRTLDELNGVSRALLAQLEKLVAERLTRLRESGYDKATVGDVRFTRREIREFTGWSQSRVKRYMRELVDLEYVVLESGRFGVTHRYRLIFENQDRQDRGRRIGFCRENASADQPGHTWPAPGQSGNPPQPVEDKRSTENLVTKSAIRI